MVHIVGANRRDRENPQHAQMLPAQRVEGNKTQAQTNVTSPLVTAFSLAALGLDKNEREAQLTFCQRLRPPLAVRPASNH